MDLPRARTLPCCTFDERPPSRRTHCFQVHPRRTRRAGRAGGTPRQLHGPRQGARPAPQAPRGFGGSVNGKSIQVRVHSRTRGIYRAATQNIGAQRAFYSQPIDEARTSARCGGRSRGSDRSRRLLKHPGGAYARRVRFGGGRLPRRPRGTGAGSACDGEALQAGEPGGVAGRAPRGAAALGRATGGAAEAGPLAGRLRAVRAPPQQGGVRRGDGREHTTHGRAHANPVFPRRRRAWKRSCPSRGESRPAPRPGSSCQIASRSRSSTTTTPSRSPLRTDTEFGQRRCRSPTAGSSSARARATAGRGRAALLRPGG